MTMTTLEYEKVSAEIRKNIVDTVKSKGVNFENYKIGECEVYIRCNPWGQNYFRDKVKGVQVTIGYEANSFRRRTKADGSFPYNEVADYIIEYAKNKESSRLHSLEMEHIRANTKDFVDSLEMSFKGVTVHAGYNDSIQVGMYLNRNQTKKLVEFLQTNQELFPRVEKI